MVVFDTPGKLVSAHPCRGQHPSLRGLSLSAADGGRKLLTIVRVSGPHGRGRQSQAYSYRPLWPWYLKSKDGLAMEAHSDLGCKKVSFPLVFMRGFKHFLYQGIQFAFLVSNKMRLLRYFAHAPHPPPYVSGWEAQALEPFALMPKPTDVRDPPLRRVLPSAWVCSSLDKKDTKSTVYFALLTSHVPGYEGPRKQFSNL